ncbi:MAG: hypothetical protein GY731_13125 [Gammaproteobacteria bacterium]|nr:hypothetical protein [Gammaproteobacteria bacterium]
MDSGQLLFLGTLLVRREGESLLYLSPLSDGSGALKRRLAFNERQLASAYAMRHVGGFGVP